MVHYLLIAAGGDWWLNLVPVVFFIIYLLNHLLGLGKANKGAGRNNVPRRPAAGGDGVERPFRQAQQPQGNPTQLNQEIEQFLKRASARRGEQQRRASPSRREPTLKMPAKRPPASLPEVAVDVRPIESKEFESVAQSVEKHIGSRNIGKRSDHLADDIVRADQQMEEHLQHAFNRRVGSLPDSGGVAPAALETDVATKSIVAPMSGASGLAKLLENREGIKQAMILNEILQRPEHRW